MCGIYGYAGSSPDPLKLKILLYDNRARGIHSYGISDGDNVVKKADDPACLAITPFIDYMCAGKENYLIIGHNRFSTSIHMQDQHSHPFLFENEDRKLIGTHNGFLHDHWEQAKELNIQYKSVDSEMIFQYMFDGASVEKVHKNLIGTIALAYIDIDKVSNNESLVLYRRRSRPLWLGFEDDGVYYSSRDEGLKAIGIEEHRIFNMPIDTAFTLNNRGDIIKIQQFSKPQGDAPLDCGMQQIFSYIPVDHYLRKKKETKPEKCSIGREVVHIKSGGTGHGTTEDKSQTPRDSFRMIPDSISRSGSIVDKDVTTHSQGTPYVNFRIYGLEIGKKYSVSLGFSIHPHKEIHINDGDGIGYAAIPNIYDSDARCFITVYNHTDDTYLFSPPYFHHRDVWIKVQWEVEVTDCHDANTFVQQRLSSPDTNNQLKVVSIDKVKTASSKPIMNKIDFAKTMFPSFPENGKDIEADIVADSLVEYYTTSVGILKDINSIKSDFHNHDFNKYNHYVNDSTEFDDISYRIIDICSKIEEEAMPFSGFEVLYDTISSGVGTDVILSAIDAADAISKAKDINERIIALSESKWAIKELIGMIYVVTLLTNEWYKTRNVDTVFDIN